MTLDTRSFFVGAAGVLGILIVGFGGGVLMSGVISDNGPRQPNKIERQAAKETKPPAAEAKPVSPSVIAAPVPDVAPTGTPSPSPKPEPQPVMQAQPAPQAAPPPKPEPQPVMQAQPAPQPPQVPSQVTVHMLGAEKPVALTQPGIEQRPSRDLSRREAKRLKAKQRREERAQRREERRKQMAERRREEQLRREEITVQRSHSQQTDADDDDDDAPVVTRREQRPFGLPFLRMFESQD